MLKKQTFMTAISVYLLGGFRGFTFWLIFLSLECLSIWVLNLGTHWLQICIIGILAQLTPFLGAYTLQWVTDMAWFPKSEWKSALRNRGPSSHALNQKELGNAVRASFCDGTTHPGSIGEVGNETQRPRVGTLLNELCLPQRRSCRSEGPAPFGAGFGFWVLDLIFGIRISNLSHEESQHRLW